MFDLTVLGPVELVGPGGEILAGRRKELSLLAYLGVGSGTASRDELATLLWSERHQHRARHSLRQALTRLRKELGDAVQVNGESVALDRSLVHVDLATFTERRARGDATAAVALWRGSLLAGYDDVGGEPWQNWLEAQRAQANALLAGAFHELVLEARDAGAGADACDWASRWTEAFPISEQPATVLITLLREEGRSAEALSRYDAFVTRIARELEEEPSEAFRALKDELDREARGEIVGAPGSIAVFSPGMVGRSAELEELHAAWRAASEGTPAMVLVEGESGIGKTLLCEEFVERVVREDEHVMVLQSRWSEAGDDGGDAGLEALLAPMARAAGLGGVGDVALSELARWVPAIRRRYPSLGEPSDDPQALAAAVREAVEAIADEAPVLLFFDDVSHAPPATEAALSRVVRHPPPGVLVIATATATTDTGLVRALARGGGLRRLTLSPLGIAGIEELIGAMIEMHPAEGHALAVLVHGESGGNPLYAIELVAALVDADRLAPDSRGIWRPDADDVRDLPLPQSLRETLMARLAALPPVSLRLATILATNPRSTVEQLASDAGLTESETEEALAELVARRLVRDAGDRTGRVEFKHSVLQRVARSFPVEHQVGPRPAPAVTGPPVAAVASRRAARMLIAGAAVVALLVVGYAAREMRGRALKSPLLAIGHIEDLRTTTGTPIAATLTDMLATNLSQVEGLNVVSAARMYDVVAQLPSSGDRPGALSAAARGAGADQLLEGSIHGSDERIVLDLRRVDLRTGQILHAARSESANVFDLVDAATVAIAAGLGREDAVPRLAASTTHSLGAYRLYEEGLRFFADADYRTAEQLFDAALRDDSTFAMASFYGWQSRRWMNLPLSAEELARTLALAARAPDRDRLLIQGTTAFWNSEPALSAVVDTLTIRYPAEIDGWFLLGMSRIWAGDFPGAHAAFDTVVVRDSLGFRRDLARCLACDALSQIVEVLVHEDSLPLAVETAREWVDRQPSSSRAWESLSAALLYAGRVEEAAAAGRRSADLRVIDAHGAVFPAITEIYAEDWSSADAQLAGLARAGGPELRREALWFSAISYRNQGRFDDALEALRTIEALLASDDGRTGRDIATTRHLGQVLFEAGRYAESVALLDSLAAEDLDASASSGLESRQRAMTATQRASVLAAAGDTVRLATLGDSVEWFGEGSASGRDRRLHHYVRGLLWRARGAPLAAADEFQRALFSPTSGFTRVNLELAGAMLDLDRPREAIAILSPAFRGPLEGSNLYLSRTELHRELGRAWEAMGRADSATFHYAKASASWQTADASLQPEVDFVRSRLALLAPGGAR